MERGETAEVAAAVKGPELRAVLSMKIRFRYRSSFIVSWRKKAASLEVFPNKVRRRSRPRLMWCPQIPAQSASGRKTNFAQ
jgi:hypothetical protein